jgi:hypothetical protein
MRTLSRDDSRYGFFRPFYESGRGHIYGLATLRDNIRDGLATTLIARHFPLPEFQGIGVEPSRPTLQPPENLILVGSASLFVRPDAHPISGDALPTSVGPERLGARLRGIDDQCCFGFIGERDRRIVNGVTGATFTPRVDPERGVSEDYGVIRRVFRGFENTVILEGVHRLGTLGAAKVATDRLCLDGVWEAVRDIDDFDESLPLEILVRATFEDGRGANVLAVDAVRAEPLFAVYNRQWICALGNGRRWHDQLPWDLHVEARGDDPMRAVATGEVPATLPRLEIEADLRGIDCGLVPSARRLLGKPAAHGGPALPQASAAEVDAFFGEVSAEADRFRVVLVERTPFGVGERRMELPRGRSDIRLVRKQFLLLLAFGRLLGCGLEVRESTIRRHFPKFRTGASGAQLERKFIGDVRGKMRDGFEPLLGEKSKPKDYVSFPCNRRERRYDLGLERCALVVRLRV